MASATKVRQLRRKANLPPPLPDTPKKEEGSPPEDQAIAISQYLMDSIASFDKFSGRLLKIQTKKGELIHFEMNEIQSLMERIITKIKEQGRLVRIVVLKARRKGISTWVSGKFFYSTTTNKNRYSMIITHEPEATDFIFKMHKRFQEHLPDFFRPTERYNNKKVLEFNNENGTGLDSAIRVGTAGKEDFGSGQLVHHFHASELGKWPRHVCKNLLLSVLQCVPPTADSEVIMESTAKGVGGEFYDRYWGSRYHYEFYLPAPGEMPALRETVREDISEDNEYTSVFIPWFVFDENKREPKPGFKRSIREDDFYGDEESLAKLHNLTDEQLAWRRWAIVNQCNSDVSLFNQEYPDTAENAFLSSSDNIFDLKQLKMLMDKAIAPIARYDVQHLSGNWIAAREGKLKVWEEPKAGRQYIIGGDPAEGLITGDFSSLDVVDCLTGKQVAQWHGIIAPDLFAIVAFWLGSRYNNALVAIERNNHGHTTLSKLQDLRYKRVYFETIVEPPNRPTKKFGWLSTKKSKPMLIDNMIAELRDNTHGIMCRETFEEMMFYKQFEDGTYGAEEGRHDDRVMSLAIAKHILSKIPKFKKGLAFSKLATYTKAIIKGNTQSITPKAWS